MTEENHAQEIAAGQRFAFGENWRRFLRSVDDGRIDTATRSLQKLLGVVDLKGLRVIDVGCGSGMFSLAAHRLGARVHSFDYDPSSVGCALELRRRFASEAGESWIIEEGSILDRDYLESLGTFDLVYSWGVLHHTGQMWNAIENAAALTAPGGLFTLAIYNDQGSWSDRWKKIKRTYNRLPGWLQPLFAIVVTLPFDLRMALSACLRLKPMEYVRLWTRYDKDRGMNRWHDILDWVGGYPFEVARPEEIFHFLRDRGFTMENMVTRLGNVGCNEFVFRREGEA